MKSKQNQLLLASVALALSLLTFAFYSSAMTEAPLAQPIVRNEAQFDYEINYTPQGYSPNFLEVPFGARVAFHNDNTIPMWTASDPHPTHTDYPAFDANKMFQPGETYIFTFSRLGTFGYHNHERSLDRGIIRVYDPANPTPEISKTVESNRAVRDKYIAMLEPGNPDSVFSMINSINSNKSILSNCHDMAHDIGHKAYDLYGFSGAMTYTSIAHHSTLSVDNICAGGYIHGILEELFLNQPDLAKHPETICSGVPKKNQDTCFHGIGHGAMFANKRDVQASLLTCRGLSIILATHRCFEGVWMEMFWGTTDHAGVNSLGWTIDQPFNPCKEALTDEKATCYLYAHLGYLRSHHNDFAGVMDLCAHSKLTTADESNCVKGIGITMAQHYNNVKLERTEVFAGGLNSTNKYAYYQGVLGYARLSDSTEPELQKLCLQFRTDGNICQSVLKNTPR